MDGFAALVALVSVIGGAMTAVAGAGTGSTLVPLFGTQFDFKLAVAAVTLPHLAATTTRTLQLWRHIDRALFLRFGIVCAVASLGGAILQSRISSPVITYAFAVLLIIAGVLGLTGQLERRRTGRSAAWLAGAASGFFGGLAGEQGGFRAVALLGFKLDKEAFVATGAAVGAVIDLVRMPVYWARQWDDLGQTWALTAIATAGAVIGIFAGQRLLRRIPQARFARVVSGVILAVGVLLFLH
jgi:uncharacterized membrane protein YfcA